MKNLLLAIATRNAHKVTEIRLILGDSYRLLDLTDFPGAPAVIEDAGTFAGNAQKKSESLARWLTEHYQVGFTLADDSGLEVDALNGEPGVHSARFAALDSLANAPDATNNAKLMRLLEGVPQGKRTARFRCMLALTNTSEEYATEFFEGHCEGRIALAANGAGGFGYDPLFIPDGFSESLAELGESVKNTISHRARALEKLKKFLAALAD